ncbi:MAG: MFS transporter [Bacillota bacterium]|jgi:GPH family glycoside/pentoside/hexuronide:cation symporter
MGLRIGSRYGAPSGTFLYCLGSFTAALLGQAFNSWAQLYYVDILKLPLVLYGTGMTIYGIWNAINDPLAGQWSDRTRTRWGRRIPFILFGTVPFCVIFVLVWTVPQSVQASANSLFAYFLAMAFLFDGLFTVVVLNWTALFPEMYPSLGERSSVSATKQALGIVGMIVGMALAPAVRDQLGWTGMGIIFGALGLAAMFLSLLGSKERPEFSNEQGLPIAEAFKYTFVNKSFLTFVIMNLFVQFTFVLLPATLPFFCKYVLGLSDAQNTLVLAPIFLVALPMVWVWGRITNRLGPRRTSLLAVAVLALALVPFAFVNSLATVMITTAFTGVGLAGVLVLVDVLIADIIDEDEVNTGARREGAYFGANAFIMRFSVSLEAIAFSVVMGTHGYNPTLQVQPATVALGLRLLMTVIPLVSLALAMIALYYYPIDGQRRARIAAALNQRRGDAS